MDSKRRIILLSHSAFYCTQEKPMDNPVDWFIGGVKIFDGL